MLDPIQDSQFSSYVSIAADPLDEYKWRSWQAVRRTQERRSNYLRMMAMKVAIVMTLLTAAILASRIAPYGVVVQFVVTIGSILVMNQAIRARYFIAAGAFGTMALIFNPIAPAIGFTGAWERAIVVTSAVPFLASLFWRRLAVSRAIAAVALLIGLLPTTGSAADLSKYRSFQLGSDPATVVKQTGSATSELKVIHRRPALIQELEWRPRTLGSSSETEPAKDVTFEFYESRLFRISVSYDRYETEGLTTGDLTEAISTAYGAATTVAAPKPDEPFGAREQLVAQWQDPQYRFELLRLSYGSAYKLVGVLKSLEGQAQAAMVEGARLDDLDAPKREAERVSQNAETERVKLEKMRVVNKAKFRP